MHRNEVNGGKAVNLTIRIFLGALLSLGVAVVFLLLGAAAISNGYLGAGMTSGLTAAACIVGTVIGGGMTCRQLRSHRLIAGVGTGVVCFMMILLCGLVIYGGSVLGVQVLLELISCICGGAISGLPGKKRKKRGKRTPGRAG